MPPRVTRPISRLRLLLPEQKGHGRAPGRIADAVDAVAKGIADSFAALGVQTRTQLHGAPSDGSPRADVALWFPDENGVTISPDPKSAPARVHVAVVVDPTSPARSLGRYDALLVPHARLVAATTEAARKAARPPVVVHARLTGHSGARDSERVERGMSGRRVVVVDVRPSCALGQELERAIVQLALKSHEAALVLVAGADDAVHKRLRELCVRHGVDAWLAAGPDALATTFGTADLVFCAPSWDEVLCAALHRTPLALLPSSTSTTAPLLQAVRDAHAVDDVLGTLQLAAAIDRRLFDIGAAAARGLQLQEALLGTEKELYDALSPLEPLPGTLAVSSRWEMIGPHADKKPQTISTTPVAAVDPEAPPPPSPAQKIEADLAALKARLKAEGGG